MRAATSGVPKPELRGSARARMHCSSSSIVAESTTLNNASAKPIGLNFRSRGHSSCAPGSGCLGP
eukprot:6454150-Lingulodinium_polyedra.AAC.1